MTDLLKRAFEKAAEAMSEEEQNEFGRWLISAIESDERHWDAAFARSQSRLESLADHALDAFRKGKTDPLDPEKL